MYSFISFGLADIRDIMVNKSWVLKSLASQSPTESVNVFIVIPS